MNVDLHTALFMNSFHTTHHFITSSSEETSIIETSIIKPKKNKCEENKQTNIKLSSNDSCKFEILE